MRWIRANRRFSSPSNVSRDILQPTVLYWYGRALSAVTDASDQMRGRAMVEAALTDFRALETVLHANLAEQFLRDGRSRSPSTARRFRPAG